MRHLKNLASLFMMLLASLTIQAQTENEAFYIYQNDGHFDGFFYDEIVKMNFSFLDTLGVEHDEIVSQEIVTADSTYRIMLSAIDSIGFVQPEIIYNPRLRVVNYMEGTYQEFLEDTWPLSYADNIIRIRHKGAASLPELRADLYPQPGDVFANFDMTGGWSAKVVSVTEENLHGSNYVVAHCKPIDDITDIFQQYVSVEQYRHDDMGNLLARRVAGRPDLNIGKVRTRAFDDLDYNLLNFTLNGHIPIYSINDNIITLDPVIEGKVDVRVVYDLSFWGSKYIGITTDVSLGGSIGLTVDGKLSGVSTGGLSQLGQLPIPAPAPIISFLFGPDGFARAEGHFRASVSSPKLNTKFWLKFEIKDWKPSFDWGPGSSKDDKKEDNNNQMAASFEINGFAQAGVAFPLKLQSLPVIGKLFRADIGGTWYVGPKFSGSVKVDLFNVIAGDNDAYDNLKDTKISLSPIDFDYEITANVSTLLSSEKKWTLADGTFSVAPTVDLKLFPGFEKGEWHDKVDKVILNGENKTYIQDRYVFKPQGNLILPMGVGVACYYLDEKVVDGVPQIVEKLVGYQIRSSKYWFNILEFKDSEPAYEFEGGELRRMVTEYDEWKTGGFKFYPIVQIWNSNQIGEKPGSSGDLITLKDNETTGLPAGVIRAKPGFEIHVDKMYEVSCDTIYVNHDGTVTTPVMITDPAKGKEGLKYSLGTLDVQPSHLGFPDWFVVTEKNGKFELSVDQGKFLDNFGKYFSLVDTVTYSNGIGYRPILRYVDHEVEDDRGPKIYVARLPNGNDHPVSVSLTSSLTGNIEAHCSTEIGGNVRYCIAENNDGNDHFRLSFEMVETRADWSGVIKYTLKNIHIYSYIDIGGGDFDKCEGTISEFEVEGGDKIQLWSKTLPCNITATSKRGQDTTTSKIPELFFQKFVIEF